MWGKQIYEGCLDLLFPPVCHVCGVSSCGDTRELICTDCMDGLRMVGDPVCSICGMEISAKVDANYICGDCLVRPPPFELCRSLFLYDDQIRSLISSLKYQKDLSSLRAIHQLVRLCDLSAFDSCDLIVPVPLHRKRLQERTFNQSLLLARACFGKRDKRIAASALQRTVNTVPQVSLDARARRRSLKNVFRTHPKIPVSGKAICLIDDVYTTGTTISQCSRALLRGGAASVRGLTFARAEVPRRGRR
ncbi:double zinc ribbon domain-containing protein [Desulforhopalus sp. 52FAK]